ncbi:activator of HSP90 ATPase [Actinorhabdospora filicis]|uniref:Activator of HSP90 ATPase n=1 Tax=Actinorhabdospora filicis TaxID=1785913 RepID=A0A9W6WDJ7_9ACTN|nr:activator of HSP90 ATPase [Actinorhabdospora filicis]
MYEILHRVGVIAPAEDVFKALTTVEGLAGWWTEDTTGEGDILRFRFPPGGFDMRVLETRPAEFVRWEVAEGPEEWVGTEIHFELRQEGEFTIVLFKHEGWRERVEFMNHCSTKWATFLMSMKRLVETGKGEPSPHDVQISDWH